LAAALAVVVFVGAAIAAEPAKAADKSNSAITGTVTKAGDGAITVTDASGKDHKLMVDKAADISCDGKVCKLEDLKNGVSVTVTTKKDDTTVATKIEAKSAKDNK
jgi:hypothetical protein